MRKCKKLINSHLIYLVVISFVSFSLILITQKRVIDNQNTKSNVELEVVVSEMEIATDIVEIAKEEQYILRADIPLDYDLQLYIHNKCIEKCIDENIVYALIWSESRFQADVISKTGDYGLMQINAKYHFKAMQDKYGIKVKDEMLSTKVNLDYGISLISDLVSKYGLEKGLAKYKGSSQNAKYAIDKIKEYEENIF